MRKCKKATLRVEQIDGKYVKGQIPRAVYEKWKEGQEIWVQIGSRSLVTDYKINVPADQEEKRKRCGYRKGYLHKGEYINKKSCEAVFYETKTTLNEDSIIVNDEDIQLLKKILDEYKDRKKNCKIQDKEWYKDFQVSKDRARILVYYAKDDKGRIYMCPACIGREVYHKTVENLLKNNGGYHPCNDEQLCSACQVFGMMDKEEKSGTFAYGSRIRFTDATLIHPVADSSTLFEAPVVLHELGEPRPSAVEFYTESPYESDELPDRYKMQGYWTYDYRYCYLDGPKKTVERIALDKKHPKIRGRKYYWHKDVNMEEFKDNQVSLMRQRVRPLKANEEFDSEPTFQFRVHFDQLSKKQIQQLKWALDFGCPDCAHKIGRGKPLGFGSVQIIVDALNIREIDENTGGWDIITVGQSREINNKAFFEGSGFAEEEIPEALKIMSNWKERPMNVSYPFGIDDSAKGPEKENAKGTHQWFRLNKMKYDNFNYNFCKTLPDSLEDAKENLEQKTALYNLIKK